MWHCMNRMKKVDKPSELAESLQSLWRSALSLINFPDDSFPVGVLHRQQKKQHNTISGVNLLQSVWLSLPHWASILFCGFPTHLLWEDGVNKPHLLQHFSHLALPFHPCSQTTQTHLITLPFSTAVFLTGLLSPFSGLSGHCCQSHLSYSGCGICLSAHWPVSSVLSKKI